MATDVPSQKEDKYNTRNKGYVAHSLEMAIGLVKDHILEGRATYPLHEGVLAIIQKPNLPPMVEEKIEVQHTMPF